MDIHVVSTFWPCAMNVGLQISPFHTAFNPFRYIPVELLNHKVISCSVFWKVVTLFSQEQYHFIFPPQVNKGSQFHHILTHFVDFYWPISVLEVGGRWLHSILYHKCLQIFFFKINFYQSMIDLQYCVSFCYTAKWITYTYTYICSFLFSFPI